MSTFISFCAGVFLLYWPYGWCWYRKEDPDEYGLRWEFRARDFMQTLAVSAFILLALTVVAMNWPWEALPRKRGLWTVLNMGASGLAAAIIEETFFRGWLTAFLHLYGYRDDQSGVRADPPDRGPLLDIALHIFPWADHGLAQIPLQKPLPTGAFPFHRQYMIWSIWFFPMPVNF
ncbi:MAG: hypothetical protein LUE09_09495 [Synergistaceae bacterium]|nr:hypothetical protein [Synergistaceae bacterium]